VHSRACPLTQGALRYSPPLCHSFCKLRACGRTRRGCFIRLQKTHPRLKPRILPFNPRPHLLLHRPPRDSRPRHPSSRCGGAVASRGKPSSAAPSQQQPKGGAVARAPGPQRLSLTGSSLLRTLPYPVRYILYELYSNRSISCFYYRTAYYKV
jgi:hypothetical protein